MRWWCEVVECEVVECEVVECEVVEFEVVDVHHLIPEPTARSAVRGY
jgi:hypothetical protein